MPKRLRIKDKVSSQTVSIYDLTADSKKKFRDKIEELLSTLSEDAVFEEDYNDEYSSLRITSFRDETDKEMAKRLEKTKKQRTRNKERLLASKEEKLAKLQTEADRLGFDLTRRKPAERDWFRDDGQL